MSRKTGRFIVGALLPIVLLLLYAAVPLSGQYGAKEGEWRYYGGDPGSTKYSPLDQINKDNVKNLRIAWRWKADNFGPRPDFYYEATPLMVGGILYTTAGSRRDVVAIDGQTGETLWMFRFDEGIRGQRAPIRSASGRGVAFWSDGKEERILHVTPGYHLVALDAKTGRPIPSFGKDGIVDLTQELDQPVPKDGQIGWNSPPLIVRGVVVVGAALGGTSTREFVKGYVRGYDVRTGKRLWIFHTIPQPGEFGNETWENDSWSYTGNVGAWAPLSGDEELGYVYVPVETPTNDYSGADRPGDNLFAESLVCLDARTGKRIWHFQLVHHPLWDYDIPTQPMLVDVTVNGKKIKAVAQLTKQAFTYVFDRVTGAPVWSIMERPVPQSDVPGEKTSPTQPFPTKPPPFDGQGVTLDDLIDFTPEVKAEAVRIASQFKLGPLFTPPIVAGSNGLKGMMYRLAATRWEGGAVDPETGIMYVASANNTRVIGLVPGNPKVTDMRYRSGGGGAVNRSLGTAARKPGEEEAAGGAPSQESCNDVGPWGLPLLAPPWGKITAIDLNTGEQLWWVPNGETADCIKNHPALKGVNIPKGGKPEKAGIMVTKTLLFAGEGAGILAVPLYSGGPMFRAHDKKTGEVIWEFKLPGNQSGIPMTYMLNGQQYIVVPVGGTGRPAELVALSLP